MAAINSVIVSFVPVLTFRFGSFSFTVGNDGRLDASTSETIRSGEIGSDFTNNPLVGFGSVSAVGQGATLRDNAHGSGHSFLSSSGAETIRSEKGKTTLPYPSLGLRSPSAESRWALGREVGSQHGHEENSGVRVVNVVIGNPLGHYGDDEESIHHLLDSPSHSESSTGSCSPPREILVIGPLAESEHKRQQDDEAEHQCLEEEGRRELERNRELQARGRQVHDDFLQADPEGQGVFATPQ